MARTDSGWIGVFAGEFFARPLNRRDPLARRFSRVPMAASRGFVGVRVPIMTSVPIVASR